MKTSAIIRIAIYACIAVLLTGILAWGIRGDGFWGIPFNGIVIGGNNYMSYNDNDYNVGNGTIDAADVDQIAVDWIAGNVEVRTTDSDRITLTETSNRELDEKYEVRWIVDNGTLRINFAKSKVHFAGIFKSLNKDLTLEIPEDMVLELLDVETVSANIHVNGLAANRMDIESVSGNIQTEGAGAAEFRGETVSGAIKGTLAPTQNVDLESVSGRIDLAFDAMPKNIDVETVSGAIILALPENDGFRVDYEKVSGNFNCEFQVQLMKNAAVYKNAGARIDLSTVSGNMDIKQR